ncbi:probable cysteine synthase B [Aspergillus terreus]|uniref:Probable cysteine synthase B n=1 Tax=Aspergillus terreus TaxID=33178 RepID=A0A5M3YKM1_ASPTE|nr:hypothetical protein ATETN484_0001000400 [Aspergillus terreus]GFF11785.1 probable cysteine synthase B [Aspergillus terreus]
MTGLGKFFSNKKPTVFRLGYVCIAHSAAGDRVPGARLYSLLGDIKFKWKEVVDHVEEVGSQDAYGLSVGLTQEGIICGPSSGLNLKGLYKLIEKRKNAGTLNQLAGPDDHIHCVFICCDTPYLYIDDYFNKLGVEYFKPIRNEELISIDQYNYDSTWILEPSIALCEFFDADSTTVHRVFSEQRLPNGSTSVDFLHPRPNKTIIDLRQPSDFTQFSLPGSFNWSLAYSHGPSLFSFPKGLRELWEQLEDTFSSPSPKLQALIDGKRILILCYNGDASRVATSVLRAKGFEADSVAGGVLALRETVKEPCQPLVSRLPN